MKIVLITVLTFVAALAIVRIIERFIKKIYNIKALYQASRHPDVTKQQQGIVYRNGGEDGERLEADQSTITPF
jgi:hypothetical protein